VCVCVCLSVCVCVCVCVCVYQGYLENRINRRQVDRRGLIKNRNQLSWLRGLMSHNKPSADGGWGKLVLMLDWSRKPWEQGREELLSLQAYHRRAGGAMGRVPETEVQDWSSRASQLQEDSTFAFPVPLASSGSSGKMALSTGTTLMPPSISPRKCFLLKLLLLIWHIIFSLIYEAQYYSLIPEHSV
jgi:hypothetical protein